MARRKAKRQPEPDVFDHRYVIGIDLGTTNSAVAYVDLTQEKARLFGDVGRSSSLRYRNSWPRQRRRSAHGVALVPLSAGARTTCSPGSTALPWDIERSYAVGEFAREQGAQRCRAGWWPRPSRGSAMPASTAPPTSCPGALATKVAQVSPVEASTRYLQHIREAWDTEMGHEAARATALTSNSSSSPCPPRSTRSPAS